MTALFAQEDVPSIFPEHYCLACKIDCQSFKSLQEHHGGRRCIKKHIELGWEPKFSTPEKKKVQEEIYVPPSMSLPPPAEPDYKLYRQYTGLDLIDGILDFELHVIKIFDLISDAYSNSENSILPYVCDFETELANLRSAFIILSHWYKNYDHLEKSCLLIQRSWRHYRVKPGSRLYVLAKKNFEFYQSF
tara:strand:+ start:135 stop:704 length:570 start_codon:yes stop_codon:yes gene_type:complete